MRLKNFTLSMLLMVAPVVASATDYYVSPAGSGSKDGSSADNAWGITELQEKFNSSNSATFSHGDNIYFAPGKYCALTTLYVTKGLNLIGAEGAERTIFTGDANKDGVVSDGDRDRVFNVSTATGLTATEGFVNVTNIDFENLNIAQGGNDTKGAIFLDNCGAMVTISKCKFYNLINSGQGANAIFSKRSTLKVVDCVFTDNKAANRGIAARLQGDINKGFTTFERCLFANNETTGAASDPCGVVMMQHGQQLNLVNCTFVNNKCNGKSASIWNGTAPDANYPRIVNVVSCTFAGNTSGAEADADKMDIYLNAASTANVYNSIVLGGITTGDNIKSEGNITDKTFADVFGTNTLTDGVLAPIARNATTVSVSNLVAALNPEMKPAADLTVDQTGATRTANVMGAYDFDPEATGVESVNDSNASLRSNGVKVLKDGRLVIEKGGKMFTVAGQQL